MLFKGCAQLRAVVRCCAQLCAVVRSCALLCAGFSVTAVFVFKKWFKTGINKLSGSPQWHITFDLKQVALKFQKPLAGENLSFICISNIVLQNNWLPWKLSKMSKFGHVTTF